MNMIHVRSLRNVFNKSGYELDIRVINLHEVDELTEEDDQFQALTDLIGDFPHRFGERSICSTILCYAS